jgi:hypothetical protein
MESIKRISYVKRVHFSEIIKVIKVRSIGEMDEIFESRLFPNAVSKT